MSRRMSDSMVLYRNTRRCCCTALNYSVLAILLPQLDRRIKRNQCNAGSRGKCKHAWEKDPSLPPSRRNSKRRRRIFRESPHQTAADSSSVAAPTVAAQSAVGMRAECAGPVATVVQCSAVKAKHRAKPQPTDKSCVSIA
ncbi:hypothetical protein MTO96_020351 [Rhipicephalus appendiculatus]